MNWTKLEALLRQAYPGLIQRVENKLPEGYVFQGGIDQDPPCIILLFGKSSTYGRIHPLLGNIQQLMTDDQLQPLYAQMKAILLLYPEFQVKTKIQGGVLAYKLWRS